MGDVHIEILQLKKTVWNPNHLPVNPFGFCELTIRIEGVLTR
jgi:hypothetical protein